MKTVIYKQLDKKILNDWKKLWEQSPYANYVNCPQWFLSVLETFEYKDFIIIAVYEQKTLKSIVGLFLTKIYGINVYSLPPGDFVCGNPILTNSTEKKATTKIIKVLGKIGTIMLNNMSKEDSEIVKKINPHLKLSEAGLNFKMTITKDELGNVVINNKKKLLKKIEGEEDKIKLRMFQGNNLSTFNEIFDLDNKSSKKTLGFNVFKKEIIKSFYKALANNFKDNFCINLLYYKKNIIAYEIGFKSSSTYFGSQIAYVNSYSYLTPGKVIAVKLIENLGAGNIHSFNFGSGDNHLKRALAKDYSTIYNLVLSKNLLARTYLYAILKLKNYFFEVLSKNRNIYSLYNKLIKN